MMNKGVKVTIGVLLSAILLTSTPVDVFASKDTTTSKYMEGVSTSFTGGAHAAIGETVVLEEPSVEENELEETEAAITGEDIVEYALQFVGNRYVYGGTSLTKGTDCSGFVMRVYEAFGFNLPRTSYDQRRAGHKVSADEMQPGDIVCYYGHVAIYIGDGKIVHAANKNDGIKISNRYDYQKVVSIRRIIE